MRFLTGGMLALGLPLAAAAALAQAPDAALRLTPSVEPLPALEPLRLPPVQDSTMTATPAPQPAAPAAQPASYGPRQISFPAGVTASFDVVYANLRGFRPLTLDLYQPSPRGMALPLVVFVHGGGWNGGDTRHAAGFADFPRELANLAAQGYVVASVSYRLSGEARFPAAVQDVKSAIRWLRGRSSDFNIDTTRVAVWGEGAGGQLAALTGVTCGVAPFEPPAASGRQEAASVCVQAVIDWYGATDLQNLAADNLGQPEAAGFKPVSSAEFQPPPASDEGSFLGCEPALCPPMAARLASPLAFISATSPPFLIQHGEEDKVVSPRQSQRLHEALRKAGVPAELITYPNVGHNFTRTGANQGASDAAAHRLAMEKLMSFLASTFPAVPLGTRVAQPRGSVY